MPAVIMSEMLRHYCLLNSVTLRIKGELHVLSHHIFEYFCTEKNSHT